MFLGKSIIKTFFCVIIFALFSCYSNPENANHLTDYSSIILSETTVYNIEINIFNKNIAMLRKNVFNEIIQNGGKILQDEILNINTYRMGITIPKNKTPDFIAKMGTFGVVVTTNIRENDFGGYFSGMEMRLINIKNMLEKYKELLQKATNISDKLTLEKEINNAEMEIEMMESRSDEMKLSLENSTITILMYNRRSLP